MNSGLYRRLVPNEPVVAGKDWQYDAYVEKPAALLPRWQRTGGLTLTAVLTAAADGSGASAAVTVLELTGSTGAYRFSSAAAAIAGLVALAPGASVFLRLLEGGVLRVVYELDYYPTDRVG